MNVYLTASEVTALNRLGVAAERPAPSTLTDEEIAWGRLQASIYKRYWEVVKRLCEIPQFKTAAEDPENSPAVVLQCNPERHRIIKVRLGIDSARQPFLMATSPKDRKVALPGWAGIGYPLDPETAAADPELATDLNASSGTGPDRPADDGFPPDEVTGNWRVILPCRRCTRYAPVFTQDRLLEVYADALQREVRSVQLPE